MKNEQDVQEIITADKDAMAKHVSRFMTNGFFSPATVIAGLQKIHGTNPNIKGPFIAAFNSAHSGNWTCPFGSTEFKADDQNGYAKYLHLGTTRIWTVNGELDPIRWQQFVEAVTQNQEHRDQKIVTKSALKAYLNQCYAQDPQENDTGRNTNSWFSSGYVQATAASKAWDEVFERLACGWEIDANGDDYEPYINLDLIYLFFEDSHAAFMAAENQNLPIAKPETLSSNNLTQI
ncbi:MAG: hypothetical protein M1486_02335 [Gammaproteobacteria bacterium]|nr:hypothetical protein [Gammaproteobacteria bacterium]